MEPTAAKLWNKNFTLMALGQIIALFGNWMLRTALPMYIFFTSGSAELMGRVAALSTIPVILITPLGGALADRFSKKKIIVFIDIFVAGGAFLYLLASGSLSVVPITIMALMIFNSVNAMINAATDSAVPLIVPQDQVLRAISVMTGITSLAATLGPPLGVIMLTEFGLESMLIVGGICFAVGALMRMFIRIPMVKQETTGNMVKMLAADMAEGLRFAVKEKPIIAKIILVLLAFQLINSGVTAIGPPVYVKQILGMEERMLAILVGFMGSGGVTAGILVGILGNKLRVQNNYLMLIAAGIFIIPISIAIFLSSHTLLAFFMITASLFVVVNAVTIFVIKLFAFIQQITPQEKLGKMMALMIAAPIMAMPLGQWMSGFLFERFADNLWIIIFTYGILIIIIGLWSGLYFKSIQGGKNEPGK